MEKQNVCVVWYVGTFVPSILPLASYVRTQRTNTQVRVPKDAARIPF
jgi:hypothetical protein